MVLKNPGDLLRLLVIAAIVYPALVLILRLSGKRTLSKLNAFDFVVTVALGSTLATILLSRDVSLLEGILALALLVTLQYVVALLAVRWPPSQRLLKARAPRCCCATVGCGTPPCDALGSRRVRSGRRPVVTASET
ncbi:DUF421 domain-containing protein [Micromonospora tarensis]|uniref:DUF421 domain-containing protein n=1 Tax=Micromonospora tarensis TaxID=2806100 RepID=A0ABS1YCR1_9ACTN|nr:DUF421 domain-containing protein [Micromonospora tarensis]MBM0275195.1 DUF421 domain-containing protein [Micromonospora tarensis]